MKFRLKQTDSFNRVAKKFFKKHRELLINFDKVTEKLKNDPFESSLKTHRLKGELKEFYACSLNYEYRLILTIIITDKEIILVDIGTHDEVY